MKVKIEIKERKKISVHLDKIERIQSIIKKEGIFYTKILLITHKKLWSLYKNKFKNLKFEKMFLPEGEEIKSLKYLEFLYLEFLRKKVDRKSLVLIFGGGVLGDLVGFACSTYMRGINYIQIPTTLLAMVDSSIGGKTAVNLKFGKNLVGSFYQPKIILCDTELLKSLPKKEIYNGLGEILKYAVINKKIFNLLASKDASLDVNSRFFKNLILECIKTKLEIVKKDEKEITGIREKLNLGHTIAHAIEAVCGYKVYSHGEAVILGLLAENFISKELGFLLDEDYEKIISLINRYTSDKSFESNLIDIDEKKIFEFIKFDKKFYQKRYRFALPIKIGEVKTVENISKRIIIDSISYVKKWMKEKLN
jgi:3-dehydroquinate synthase